ncbi:MAG: protein phosphatase 2C domain-containing protein [Bacteroidota bacterium]
MEIYEFSKMGAFHTDHNEDALAIVEIDTNTFLLAVMDGCSMGKESHFASTLIAKLLRKIGKEVSYDAFSTTFNRSPSEYLDKVLKELFEELKHLKNTLFLETAELLSTLTLCVIDTEKRTASVIVVGDGLVCCNGKLYNFDQNNRPNYLGYHLRGSFDAWSKQETQRLELENIHDLSLSTDGILSFQNHDGKSYETITNEQIIHRILIDKTIKSKGNALKKSISEIEEQFGVQPGDDLTVIRFLIS